MASPQRITALLDEWSHGDRAALDALIPIVEAELHRLARSYMSRERPGHTLQATAVVNEAYIRLDVCARVVAQPLGHVKSLPIAGSEPAKRAKA